MLAKILGVLIIILLPILEICEDIDLSKYEKQIFSQTGEDGVLEKKFQVLDINKGYCVEFGAADGYYLSNTFQFRNQSWDSLLLDGAFENKNINLYREWITKDNIVRIFQKHNVPYELDLLSIDIDSNDWYVWHELGKVYKPKVLIIEYNPFYGRYEDRVIKYNPNQVWDQSTYYGASFQAYFNLGRKLGYSLVYATTLNAIFIRDDLLIEKKLLFKDVNDPLKLYKDVPYEGAPSCLQSLKNMPSVSSYELLNSPSS